MSKSATKVALNNLYYFNKKTQTFDLTYDQITRAAKFITRANERNKTLGNKQGKTLLTSLADRIKSSKNGEIFIDHDWISTITDCLPEQNTNIMGQLADILDFKYRRSVVFEGKKRHYGLIVKFTHDGQKRLTNPELFYDVPSPQKAQKTSKVTPKKIEVMTEKNRSSTIYTRDITRNIKDLSDLCSSEDMSFGIESQDLKNQDTYFNSSNQTEQEANTEFNNMTRMDRMIAKEQARRQRDALEGNSFEERLAREIAKRDQEQLALAKQQETAQTQREPPKVISCQESQKPQEQKPIQVQIEPNDIHTKNGNVYNNNILLNEFDFTDELIDAVREKSNKPHFSNGRIIAIIRNIVASNPKVRIWGGKNAFINYMVKAVNNEKEFTKEEKSQSLIEMKRKEAEQVMYDFKHRVIRYF